MRIRRGIEAQIWAATVPRQKETWSELKFVESKDNTISGWISCGV